MHVRASLLVPRLLLARPALPSSTFPFYITDSNIWARFDTLFLPDATSTFVDVDGNVVSTPDGLTPFSWTSLEAWTAFFNKAFEDVWVIHLVGGAGMGMVGEDEVKAVFPVVYHVGPKGYGKEQPHETGGGHYHERWVRKRGVWFCREL